MLRKLGHILILLGCFLQVNAQANFLQSLDQESIPDSSKINQINDYAWQLLRKQPDSADFLAREAIKRAVGADSFPKGLVNAHIVLGILNKDRGFFESSVEHYLQALPIAEASGDFLRVSTCLNNLGSVYQAQGNFSKALENFQRSLEIEKAQKSDKAQISIRLYNIGESFLKLDSLDEAYAYYYQSLLLESEINSEEGIFYARLGIGQVDTRKRNFEKAKEELEIALELGIKLENYFGVCETELALSNLSFQKGDYAEALALLQKTLKKTQDLGYQALEIEVTSLLAMVYEAQRNFPMAIQFLKRFHDLEKKVNSSEVNSRIAEFQMKYELEKKEQVLALALKENELRESEIKYERKLRNYLLFTVIFSVLLILFNLRKNRKRSTKP